MILTSPSEPRSANAAGAIATAATAPIKSVLSVIRLSLLDIVWSMSFSFMGLPCRFAQRWSELPQQRRLIVTNADIFPLIRPSKQLLRKMQVQPDGMIAEGAVSI
jgi:hypothetical protein